MIRKNYFKYYNHKYELIFKTFLIYLNYNQDPLLLLQLIQGHKIMFDLYSDSVLHRTSRSGKDSRHWHRGHQAWC